MAQNLKVHFGFITALCAKPRPAKTTRLVDLVTCKECNKRLLRTRDLFA